LINQGKILPFSEATEAIRENPSEQRRREMGVETSEI